MGNWHARNQNIIYDPSSTGIPVSTMTEEKDHYISDQFNTGSTLQWAILVKRDNQNGHYHALLWWLNSSAYKSITVKRTIHSSQTKLKTTRMTTFSKKCDLKHFPGFYIGSPDSWQDLTLTVDIEIIQLKSKQNGVKYHVPFHPQNNVPEEIKWELTNPQLQQLKDNPDLCTSYTNDEHSMWTIQIQPNNHEQCKISLCLSKIPPRTQEITAKWQLKVAEMKFAEEQEYRFDIMTGYISSVIKLCLFQKFKQLKGNALNVSVIVTILDQKADDGLGVPTLREYTSIKTKMREKNNKNHALKSEIKDLQNSLIEYQDKLEKYQHTITEHEQKENGDKELIGKLKEKLKSSAEANSHVISLKSTRIGPINKFAIF